MKINRISCNHFAGLNGKKLELNDGINVVCENNEEGKSTIIDLMYQALFQPAKQDKEFNARCFPQRTDGVETNVVDGDILFEKDGNVSTINKRWNKNGKGTGYYSDTEGTTLEDSGEIAQKVTEILGGTSGVYKEIVFDSKRFKSETIKNLFEAGKDTQKTISEVLQVTRDSSDGVSMGKVDSVIEVKDKLFGGSWDYDTESITDRSKPKNYGNIARLTAQLELVEETRDKVEQLEMDKSAIYSKWDEKEALRKKQQDLLNNFGVVTKAIDDKDALEKAKGALKELNKRKAAYDTACEVSGKAKELHKEYEAAVIMEQYKKALALKTSYEDKKAELDALIPVTDKDAKRIRERYDQIDRLNKSGSGINVTACVEQLGDTPVQIKYLDGTSALEGAGEITIDRIVEVEVPGVMKLTIKPKGFDISQVREQIGSYADAVAKDFEKFGVDGIAELDTKVDLYKTLSEEVKKLESDYRNYLARIEKTWETLEEQYRLIPDEFKNADNMSVDAVKVRIAELCGSADIESFCRVNEKTISDYVDDDIEDRLKETMKTVETLTSKVEADGQIPEEYMGITDSQQYTEDMKSQIDSLTAELETLASDINDVNDQIKALNESLRSNGDYDFSHFDDDYYEEIRRLNGELEEAKREGRIWHELRVVFDAVKAGRPAVPHVGFDADFLKFMRYITGDTVSAAAMNDDLSVDVVSGVNKMSYDILSDGTAETVALAFRLAMLKSVFPDGGGFAIFDDPLVNMDDYRKQRSVELIKKFAEDNQVIFVTCHSEYKDAFEVTELSKIEKV